MQIYAEVSWNICPVKLYKFILLDSLGIEQCLVRQKLMSYATSRRLSSYNEAWHLSVFTQTTNANPQSLIQKIKLNYFRVRVVQCKIEVTPADRWKSQISVMPCMHIILFLISNWVSLMRSVRRTERESIVRAPLCLKCWTTALQYRTHLYETDLHACVCLWYHISQLDNLLCYKVLFWFLIMCWTLWLFVIQSYSSILLLLICD